MILLFLSLIQRIPVYRFDLFLSLSCFLMINRNVTGCRLTDRDILICAYYFVCTTPFTVHAPFASTV